ncbi:MAG: MBL fold metallo-hydrolase [Coriobacteriia bacterium]|nr:MBL fold metallo-hydrolase [Coriobacteriia bacterium]
MAQAVEVIRIDGGSVNAYLLKNGDRFVLVDTLTRGKRASLERQLAAAGCSASKLGLIVATHGDSDHVGSCAYLRDKMGAPIGMHEREAVVAETGDMRAARPHAKEAIRVIFGVLMPLFGLRKSDRFTPDVLLADGDDLSAYGVDARVLYQPGHSEGSISVLTANGDLICGDLMTNTGAPQANTLVDDAAEMAASVARARQAGARTVYPGHGKPFAMSELR